MRDILGTAKTTVREFFKGVKYSSVYHQRDYKWDAKQIRELVEDLRFAAQSDLPFRVPTTFKKADLQERGILYRKLAEKIWDPEDLLREVGA